MRLVSVSFDESMKDVTRALEESVRRNPALARLRELGASVSGGDARKSTLEALRREGIRIDRASEEAVLATLSTMGADFDKLALLERDPFTAAFGRNAELYLVAVEARDLCYQAVGESAPPIIFVIDRRGKLHYSGYPMQDFVTELVETLLAEDKSD